MKHTFRMSAILVSNQFKFYIAVLVSELFPTGKLCILGQINADLSNFWNIFYLMLLGIKIYLLIYLNLTSIEKVYFFM
jgi:hypothetical protein